MVSYQKNNLSSFTWSNWASVRFEFNVQCKTITTSLLCWRQNKTTKGSFQWCSVPEVAVKTVQYISLFLKKNTLSFLRFHSLICLIANDCRGYKQQRLIKILISTRANPQFFFKRREERQLSESACDWWTCSEFDASEPRVIVIRVVIRVSMQRKELLLPIPKISLACKLGCHLHCLSCK